MTCPFCLGHFKPELHSSMKGFHGQKHLNAKFRQYSEDDLDLTRVWDCSAIGKEDKGHQVTKIMIYLD